MNIERTYVMVKPDGVQRKLVGSIIRRFEEKGLKLVGLKVLQISNELASEHYAEHKGKAFYGELVDFITSGPVVAMVWEGLEAVKTAREMMGKTNPLEAAPGTIRGDYGLFMGNNVIHGSDSLKSAAREINLFFDAKELVDYKQDLDRWVYGSGR